jgi:RimJ/RimL family protein N-acetyltransferase
MGGGKEVGEWEVQMSIIYGERIRLRAVEREDVKKFHEWVNDPEVTEGLSLYLPMSMVDEETWFETMITRPAQQKAMAIEVREGEGWRLIGNCAFFDIDTVAHSAEFGIMIGEKAFWNKGYGTETVTLLLRHGFETLNLNRVSLRVYADNPRARRSYEKAGFVLEGTMRQAVYKRGRFGDIHIMSVLRSEWDARRESA